MTPESASVQQVLNDEDMEGLLRLGAPLDEYQTEAEMISKAIAQVSESELSGEHLTAVVRTVWTEMFGPFSEQQSQQREAAFQRVARRLLTVIGIS